MVGGDGGRSGTGWRRRRAAACCFVYGMSVVGKKEAALRGGRYAVGIEGGTGGHDNTKRNPQMEIPTRTDARWREDDEQRARVCHAGGGKR